MFNQSGVLLPIVTDGKIQENMSGIYVLYNTISKKRYVGKSVDIKGRLSVHLSYIKRGSHQNINIREDAKKYPAESFVFFVVEAIDKIKFISELEDCNDGFSKNQRFHQYLYTLEDTWIQLLKSLDYKSPLGYNQDAHKFQDRKFKPHLINTDSWNTLKYFGVVDENEYINSMAA